ncbi:hypothetical protein ILUMI_04892 [Ignelater luminosus]|uniref:N-acetyltransferase domain-containing protein n=1 Tax=Ignelater luminosus TaxID=2038154 RepID=A0A8K0DBL5_IGNLU|nr:hypothetical protein ILUMI_04892 [Ignelater luminosus]
MSRKLRKEEEKFKQLKEEEEEVEDKYEVQMRRIYSPLVWHKTESGFSFQDLKEDHFNEVIQMFQEHYVYNEVLCKNTELYNDKVSMDSYAERMMFYLKDGHSIMVVDKNYKEEIEEGEEEEEKENTEETKQKKKKKKEDEKIKIVAALILRVIHRNDYARVFSRVQLVEGEAMKKCIAFKNFVNRKVDVFAKFDCDSILRFYDICILPEYRNRGLSLVLAKCGLNVARAMKVPVVMGVFSDFRMQKLAKKVGMETLYEMNYVDWRDPDGEMIFDDPGAGNYTLALMAGLVSILPPEPPKPKPEEEAPKKPPKITRAEKRALLEKMKT